MDFFRPFTYALFWLLLCLSPLVMQVHAQSDELRVIEVVPDASASQQVGEVEHAEHTGSRSHIDSSALQTKGSGLASLIAHEAGVQSRQSGGIGSYSTISVRAASSAQTNIFFDGILLNNASSGAVDLSQLDLLNIASIDIYRGSTPIQLGVAAIGGAVNLKTSRSSKPSTALLTSVGSFGSSRLSLSRQIAGQDWDASAAVGIQRSSNRFDLLNAGGTPLNSADDVTEKRRNAEFSRSSLLLKLGRQVGAGVRYDGLLQIADRKQGIPHSRNVPDNRANYSTQSLQFQANRRVSSSAADSWSSSTGIFLNGNNEDYDDRFSQIGLGAQLTRSETNVLGARTYWEQVGRNATLALNGEIKNETLLQWDRLDRSNSSASRSRFDGAVQYSLFAWDEKLLLTPAVRVQSLLDDYDGLQRQGKTGRSDSSAQLQLGARWEVDTSWEATINAGQHQREPLFYELFGDRGLYIGNDEIVAEFGSNFDAGLHWASDAQGQRDHSVSASLIGFLSLRDELIVSTCDSRGICRSENTGKARITGAEAAMDWQLGKQWQASFNITLQSAKNLSKTSGYTGKQLPGEATIVAYASVKHLRKLTLSGSVFDWNLWYEFDVSRNRFFDTPNLLPAKDRLTQNVGMTLSARRTSLSFRINNFADQETQDFNGFSKPGRSFELAMSYSL